MNTPSARAMQDYANGRLRRHCAHHADKGTQHAIGRACVAIGGVERIPDEAAVAGMAW